MKNGTKHIFSGTAHIPLVYTLFEDTAKSFPKHIAVSFEGEQLTYESLLEKVQSLGSRITVSASGEELIGVSTSRSIDMIVAVLAVLAAGKAYLPLDPAYPVQRLQQIVADSGIKTCISTAADESFFTGLGLKGHASLSRPAQAIHIPAVKQNQNIYVLYTSGSTGIPKGVYMTQKAMSNLILWQHQHSVAGPDSRTLQFAPLSFDVSFQEIFATLTTGATLVLVGDDLRLDPVNLLKYITETRIDRIFLPFVALQFLAEAASSTQQFPQSLKEIMTAGEQLKITPQVKEFFKGLDHCALYNQYGPTECHVVTQLELRGTAESWPLLPNIGTPIANTQIYIIDQNKNLLPDGETGELAIAGLGLAEGYLNRPELTAEKFVWISVEGTATRIYLTGDLAAILPDGSIDFLGRRDDQVKIRGYRIELGEIEVLLNAIEGVKQAIVIAKNDLSGQSRLLAYLVAGNGPENTSQVRKYLEEQLPDYMIPSSFIWMEDLPKTSSGKVDKKALPLPERKRPELSVLYTVPRTAGEKKIAAAWATVLELDTVGINDNFFELGGNSLLALKTVSLLRSQHHIELPITKLYQFPSISQILNHLNADSSGKVLKRKLSSDSSQPVAVIGMAGRFPGAKTIDELWEVLRSGKETTTFFTREELDSSIPEELKNDPDYVGARGIIEDAELFDPLFFGINPKLAEVMDPQQRIFLEISRDVLEKSGHLPSVYDGLIGVFAGSGNNSYYQHNVAGNAALISQVGNFQVMTVNEKDYISSRTAYELDLKGPAVSVFSACSTSLLAVSQAVESLRKNQCDVAIAGGASVTSPIKSGHIYQEGAMLSKDGHCRSFDESSTGTVFSDGAGVVLLKTLAAAERDGDTIYGVIRGTGVNNDGSNKGSFTAPSTDGQAAAIAMAISDADIDPATISYIEAHGTGTPLGDPIEIEGLKQAFGEQSAQQYCAIGSIKSNMGHMTAAAGVAGLIKTTLALYHQEIPPSINFDRPNPNIDFGSSPFYVNQKLKPWDSEGVRRAGISSFGVGGTNVHVVMEEYAHPEPVNTDQGRTKQIFSFSAKSPESLQNYKSLIKNNIDANPEINLADIAYTLQTTRENFNHRSFIIAGNKQELEASLAQPSAAVEPLTSLPGETVFLFPGQGAQYLNMGAELYRNEEIFRTAIDECAVILTEYIGRDIRELIYTDNSPQAEADISNTKYTQPALFVVSYAVAKLWISWGIQPSILCGHSIGEYVAAHLAGVFSLKDGLKLIATRGDLVSKLPGGSMLSVRAAFSSIENILPSTLSLAAVNSPKLCVVAGTDLDINAFQEKLDEKQVLHKKLLTSHAFHSWMMDPVLNEFAAVVGEIKLNRPQKPIVSTVTGDFLTDAEAQDPAYWTSHLRKTVLFSPAIDTVLKLDNPLLIECGPGNTCTTLAWQHGSRTNFNAVASLDKKESAGATESILTALGKVWQLGLSPEWKSFYQGQKRRRIDLPTYSYNRKRFWAEPKQLPYTLNQPITESYTAMRKDTLTEKIKDILENASGIEMDGVTPEMSFIEIGLDSLLLTQVALIFKKEFALPITFRQLNEEYSTIDTLAAFVDQSLPAEKSAVRTAAAPVQNYAPQPAASFTPSDSALGLIAQQLQLLSRQVELMQGTPQASPDINAGINYAESAAPSPVKVAPSFSSPNSAAQDLSLSGISAEELAEIKKPFGAVARIEKQATSLAPAQKEFLDQLTLRYNQKTAASKAFAQKNRAHMADPRVVSGFKPYTKEIVYSIVTNKSLGSHLWDIDGNEYIDALNGFGSNLLGYQHPALKAAVLDQVEKGYEIGPQHELAGELSALICEFTGFDRAALCNTGSEAVLGAMRIARTVTGRSMIVAFSGSYHGINDEVIIRGTKKLKSFPAAPGILPEAVQNMLILDYGTDESLEIIRERAHELAAVLVEPVQSRRPEFQPVDFLKEVREITLQSETVLIFDEVITGFRAHQGGTQAMFGIQADLGTYGKVIGGGMPVGAIAGKKQFMDALDGGFWKYGDDSFPEIGVTYFAGTFVRHPLALAAGRASLLYMKEKGTALQATLNQHTTYLAGLLNSTMEEFHLPMYAAYFGSLWKIKFKEEYPYSELLFTLMREKGIHIWDGFPCFLTEAHTMDEIELIAAKFRESIIELISVDLIPLTEPLTAKKTEGIEAPPVEGAKLGRDQAGNPAWFIADPENPSKYLQVESKI
ncbi:amino acid adenylation domain-containing protein [Pedobacter westerhofensis]|uniref:Amino acid adenylation domain-containing protein n=1 Tax=Pedobacter westerhofensis TaxID=425512 RepID=A0A521E700_9SPHI|nr:polyketide synthase [Pedobacter westerhofensis]SMO79718.1 amino acid adenylation domain-containing protein [Pedobacter westerhofensis]